MPVRKNIILVPENIEIRKLNKSIMPENSFENQLTDNTIKIIIAK